MIRSLLAKMFSRSNLAAFGSMVALFGGVTTITAQSVIMTITYMKYSHVRLDSIMMWCIGIGLVHIHGVMLYAALKETWEEDLGMSLNDLLEQKEKDDATRNSGED